MGPEETRDVRPSEELDWPALAAYLRGQLPRAEGLAREARADLTAGMTVRQFPGGHSNLTYLIRFGGSEFVLRRPPLGPVPPRAHDMVREYRWLAALSPLFPLAPMPLLLCDDPAIIGSVFYVMERRRGLVIRHEEPPGLAGQPEMRRRVSEALIDTLADLHTVDASGGRLAPLGKPAGFVERQVRGWTDRWLGAKTSEIEDMDAAASWLAAHLPPEPATPSVIHGDFKLDNVVLDPRDPTRLVAVLDWEMCALGDPLVDVGIFLAYWVPTAPPTEPDALSAVTDRPGWLSRDRLLERYARRAGRDLTDIRFYETFAAFKLAVVLQQIFFRYVRGQTDDPRFGSLGARVTLLARRAASLGS